MVSRIDERRIEVRSEAEPSDGGLYVVYWMTAARRTFWNFSLQRAADWSRELGKPLVVCEPVARSSFADRPALLKWVLDGFPVNAQRLELAGVLYHPFIETAGGESAGLLEAITERATVVVEDYDPYRKLETRARSDRRWERVDSTGILYREERAAAAGSPANGSGPGQADVAGVQSSPAFREWFRRRFPHHVRDFPERNPLAKFHVMRLESLLPKVTVRFPAATGVLRAGGAHALPHVAWAPDAPPADGTAIDAGSTFAQASWRELRATLPRYVRRQDPLSTPSDQAFSLAALGTYLRVGHLSVHQVLAETWRAFGWTPEALSEDAVEDEPAQFWGLEAPVASFLDDVIVGRELDLWARAVRGG